MSRRRAAPVRSAPAGRPTVGRARTRPSAPTRKPTRKQARPSGRSSSKVPARGSTKGSGAGRGAKATSSRPRSSTPAGGRVEMRRARESRRARMVLVGAAVFAVAVLATSMPVSALLSQNQALATTSAQVNQVKAQNQALAQEAARLGNTSTVDNLARGDFGFVQPGQKAYDVLPAAGAPAASASLSGHVPLDGPPVVPGSAQSENLLGGGADPVSALPGSASPTTTTGTGGSGSKAGSGSKTGSGPDFWSRLAGTLEFWR